MDDWTTHPAAARLLGVHALLRRDITAIRKALTALTAGRAGVSETGDVVATLNMADPAGSFRMQCLAFCGFLHSHHAMEDGYFPQMAAVEPGLEPVVSRLMRQHEDVADLLDRLRSELGKDAPEVPAVGRHLADLADHLDTHLDEEEEHIGPALARQA